MEKLLSRMKCSNGSGNTLLWNPALSNLYFSVFFNNARIDKLSRFLFQDYFLIYFFYHFLLCPQELTFKCFSQQLAKSPELPS